MLVTDTYIGYNRETKTLVKIHKGVFNSGLNRYFVELSMGVIKEITSEEFISLTKSTR